MPGDSIGPEVVDEGVRALKAVAARFGHQFEIRPALLGGIAIDTKGTALPEETLQLCQEADAVLLGAVSRAGGVQALAGACSAAPMKACIALGQPVEGALRLVR